MKNRFFSILENEHFGVFRAQTANLETPGFDDLGVCSIQSSVLPILRSITALQRHEHGHRETPFFPPSPFGGHVLQHLRAPKSGGHSSTHSAQSSSCLIPPNVLTHAEPHSNAPSEADSRTSQALKTPHVSDCGFWYTVVAPKYVLIIQVFFHGNNDTYAAMIYSMPNNLSNFYLRRSLQ